MAGDDPIKRYIEAGMALTEATMARAEEFLRDLRNNGQDARNRAQTKVGEVKDDGLRQVNELLSFVRQEVARQLGDQRFATAEDLAELERRLDERLDRIEEAAVAAATPAPAAKRAVAKAARAAAARTPEPAARRGGAGQATRRGAA